MPSCEACQVGVPLINTGVGATNEPIGACIQCSSLACGHHGIRTPKPEFRCIECEVTLQAACGANGADWDEWYERRHNETDENDSTAPDASSAARRIGFRELQDLGIVVLAREAQAVFLAPFYSTQDLTAVQIPTVQEWVDQRPNYQRLFEAITERAEELWGSLENLLSVDLESPRASLSDLTITPVQALWMVMNEEARSFFVLALVMVEQLRLPLSRLSEGLVLLAKAARLDLPEQLPEKMTVWVPDLPPTETTTME